MMELKLEYDYTFDGFFLSVPAVHHEVNRDFNSYLLISYEIDRFPRILNWAVV